MSHEENARPRGNGRGTGGEQVGQTGISVTQSADHGRRLRRWQRVEIDRCPRGMWGLYAWRHR